ETHDREGPAGRIARDDADGAVHESHPWEGCVPRTGKSLGGYRPRTVNLPRGAGRDGTAGGSEHDLRGEHGKQPVEVTPAAGRQECIDDLSLPREIRVRNRHALHPAAR